MHNTFSIEALAQGDIKAMSEFYQKHDKQILNHAFRILLDREKAEDLLHDLCIKIPRLVQNFRGEAKLETWLFRIVQNEAIYRKRQESRRNGILALYWQRTPKQPSSEGNEYDRLNALLEKLDPLSRSLLWLKDAEGLKVEELAEINDKPVGTIKAKLARARKKMKHWLEMENV